MLPRLFLVDRPLKKEYTQVSRQIDLHHWSLNSLLAQLMTDPENFFLTVMPKGGKKVVNINGVNYLTSKYTCI